MLIETMRLHLRLKDRTSGGNDSGKCNDEADDLIEGKATHSLLQDICFDHVLSLLILPLFVHFLTPYSHPHQDFSGN